MKLTSKSSLSHLEFTAIRRSAGLTQEEFAAKIGLHRITLSRYESGLAAIPLFIELAARQVAGRAA